MHKNVVVSELQKVHYISKEVLHKDASMVANPGG